MKAPTDILLQMKSLCKLPRKGESNMQFASRQKRMMFYSFGIGVGVEIAFCIAIALYFVENGDWVWPAFILFLAIQAAGIVLMIKGAIAIAIAYALIDKRVQEEAVYDALTEMKMPRPQAYELSPEDYLLRIAEDESAPAVTRVKAATFGGMLAGARPHLGFLRAMFLSASWERGMVRYRRDNPQTENDDDY